MAIGGIALAFIAGVLSVLSPCVLPILPIVLGAAASKHRLGPVALAAGLSISFVIVGLFIASIGHSIGLSGDAFRYVAAVLIIAIGAILCCRRCKPGWPLPVVRSQPGRISGLAIVAEMGFPANSGSAPYWAPYGVLASADTWSRVAPRGAGP